MGNIIKFIEERNTTIAKIIASVFVLTLVSASILPVFAAFNPGDTLDPGCLPSDPDCTVLISSGATTTWGAIVGTLSDQTDLQAILDGKLSTTTAAATYLTQADASSTYLTIINASTTNWNSFYDTPSSRITAGTGLSWSGNTLNATGGGSGTVTSVGLTVPTGLSVSGSPVTTSGTLAISLESGYVIPLSASTTAWNTFYATPASQITAGTGLSWSGNTLNSTSGTVNSGLAGQVTYYGSNGTVVSGTSTLFINNEKVGIGTTTPNSQLTLAGTGNTPEISLHESAGNGTVRITANGSSGFRPSIGTVTNHPFTIVTNSATRLTVGAAGGLSIGNTFYTTEPGANHMIVEGNVGIGTTTVSRALTVNGSAYFLGTTTAACFSTNGTTCIGGAPGGGAGAVQFNNGSILSGTSSLTWDNTNRVLTIAGTTTAECFTTDGINCIGGGSGLGTVTSVDMTVPTGLTVAGGPITSSGTFALSLASGYTIPLSASTTNWNTFYTTPSNRITAGSNLSWSGNTLNVNGATWGINGSDIYYNSGRVGVGTTTPGTNFVVAGSAYISGTTTSACFSTDGATCFNLSQGLPGGTEGYIQFNEGGDFGATSSLFWDNTNQRLGIGTSTPGAGVDVLTGDVRVQSPYGFTWQDNPGGGSGDTAYIRYITQTGEDTQLQIGVGNDTEDDIVFIQGGSTRMSIYNGNVGIGTTTPFVPLTVSGNSYFAGNITNTGNLTTNGVFTSTATSTLANVILSGITGSNQCLQVDSNGQIVGTGSGCATASSTPVGSDGYVQFTTAGAFDSSVNFFWDNANQRLGIGTTTPGAALDVFGDDIQMHTGYGLSWLDNPGGGSGDDAWMRYVIDGAGENTQLQIGIANDGDDDIAFFQDEEIRMRIINGNVGIGVLNPSAMLSVGGNISATGTIAASVDVTAGQDISAGGDLTVTGTTTSGQIVLTGLTGFNQCLQVDTDGNVTGTGSGCAGGGSAPGGSPGYFQFNDSGILGGSSQLYWDDANDRVAIGTTTPSALFTVAGASNFWGSVGVGMQPVQGQVNIGASGSGSLGGDLWLFNTASSQNGASTRLAFSTDSSTDSTPNASIRVLQNGVSGSSVDMIFDVWNGTTLTEGLRIFSNGRVGIGTTTPMTELTVDGTITAGCFSTDGGNTCITGSGGSGTVNSGTAGQVAFYNANGTAVNGTSTLRLVNESVLIGTTTKSAFGEKLAIKGDAGLRISDSSNDDAFEFGLYNDGSTNWALFQAYNRATATGVPTWFESPKSYFTGNVGIGTSSPDSKLSVAGTAHITGETVIGNIADRAALKVNGTVFGSAAKTNSVFDGTGVNDSANFVGSEGYWAIRTATNNSYNLDMYNGGSPLAAMTVAQDGLLTLGAYTGGGDQCLRVNNDGEVEAIGSDCGGGSSQWTTSGDNIYSNNGGLVYVNKSGTISGDIDTPATFLVQGDASSGVFGESEAAINISGADALGEMAELIFAASPGTGSGDVYKLAGVHGQVSGGDAWFGGDLVFTTKPDAFDGSLIERMRITSTGNVGIGTTTPAAKLDIITAAASDGFLIRTSTSGQGGITFKPEFATGIASIQGTNSQLNAVAALTINPEGGNLGVGDTNPAEKLSVDGNIMASSLAGGGDQCLRATNDGVIEVTGSDCGAGGSSQWLDTGSDIYFDTGNVGIGTDSPYEALDVKVASAGTNNRSTVAVFGTDAWSDGETKSILFGGNNGSFENSRISAWGQFSDERQMRFDVHNGTSWVDNILVLDASGNVGIGTVSPSTAGKLTLNDGGIVLTGSQSAELGTGVGFIKHDSGPTGFYYGTGSLVFKNNSGSIGDKMTLDSSGNLGIGTTSPAAKLQVQGDIVLGGDGSTNKYYYATNGAAIDTNWSTGLGYPGSLITNGGITHTVYGGGPGYGFGVRNTAGDRLFEIQGSNGQIRIPTLGGGGDQCLRVDNDGDLQVTGSDCGGGGGSGTVNSGTAGQIAFYNSSGTAVSGTSSIFIASTTGNVGIGTTTPGSLLTVAGTTTALCFSTDGGATCLSGGGGSSQWDDAGSDIYFTGGNVGIGTSTPYEALTVDGTAIFSDFITLSTTTTSYVAGSLDVGGGSIIYDNSTGITAINNLELGGLSFEENAGVVSWVDMPLTDDATAGTIESYSAQIAGLPVLTVFGLSDGAGSATNLAVGIGTTTPTSTLTVDGTVSFNNIGVAGAMESALCLSADGQVRASTGQDCTASSERFKHDIETLTATSGLSFVQQLRPVSFKMNGTDEAHLGFIAEEIALLDSRLVFTDVGTTTPRGVRYQELTAVLAKAIQELDAKIASSTFATSTASNSGIVESITNWIGDKITVALGIFGELRIGSSEKPTGITLYDEETGEPYCLKIKNGASVTAAGICSVVDRTPEPEEEPIDSGDDTDEIATTTDPIDDTASSTPDVASSTDPIVEEEPADTGTSTPEVVEEETAPEITEPEIVEETPVVEEESEPEDEVPAETEDSATESTPSDSTTISSEASE